jgi:hypothetical protein
MDDFCLVIMDFSIKKFYYLDPQFENLELQQNERALFVSKLLNRFLLGSQYGRKSRWNVSRLDYRNISKWNAFSTAAK